MSEKTRGRSASRRHVFHLIYGLPFCGVLDAPALAKAKAAYFSFLDEGETSDYGFENLARPKGRDADYVDRAFWGVYERLEEIDGVIEKFLRDWTLPRIPKTDLAIMRLAIYEILCEKDVPPGVAVNEAVELAKTYGTDDSPAFVNGVLANVVRASGKKS